MYGFSRFVSRPDCRSVRAGAAEDQAAEGHPPTVALGPLELARYTQAWNAAGPDRRDRVRELLEREGYAPGEFRDRGLEHFGQVISLLEGKDEAP